jgi:acetoin utilization deacetylase AcuC-like enzyme
MKVFYHPGYAAPIGAHIMPMKKFALVAEGLSGANDVDLLEPAPVTKEDILRVHAPEYVAAVRTGEPRDLAESQKFPWSPELFPAVCLTNGGCLAAARQALRDGVSSALASGFHHACRDHGGGFCTFNGLIVALDALAAAGEIRLGAVLDMDLHYGNGTAELANGRPHVFALSIYGNDYGSRADSPDAGGNGERDGENHRSFALPEGCDRATLLRVMDEALPLIAKRRPDVMLYQAGADPYFEDPYSRLALDHEDLLARDRKVFAFARQHRIPLAWVLAGGYTKDVRKVVQVHLNTFEAWRDAYGETGDRRPESGDRREEESPWS